jgi:hypothetical protein
MVRGKGGGVGLERGRDGVR